MLNENSQDASPVYALVQQLSAEVPVYYGMGNHELGFLESYPDFVDKIQQAGAVVVDKSHVDVMVSGQSLRIGGLYDYAFALDGNKINWSNLLKKVRGLHMYVFFMNLLDIGEKYLGFDWEASGCPRPVKTKFDNKDLLKDILDGGVYGGSTAGRIHSGNITLSAFKNQKMQSGKVSLKTSLFPSKAYMETRYGYVKKCGWLLPVAWLHRMIKYLQMVMERKKKGEKDLNSIVVGKQRLILLKKYGS